MKKPNVIYIIVFLTLILAGCSGENNVDVEPSINGSIIDNADWYSDSDGEVFEVRVNIPDVNDMLCAPYDDPTGAERPCTFTDITADDDAWDDYEPIIHVQVEADGYESPTDVMNAQMKQKGKSTRRAEDLDSYRIRQDAKEDLVFDERTLQLNKSPYDRSRIRNKIAYDFFREIPNITSSKTRFVNLKVYGKDTNCTSPVQITDDLQECDKGLFTHVEKTDEFWLSARGMNVEDNIFKAQDFGFIYPDERLELDSKGDPVNEALFEEALELDSGEDYYKLLEMVKAVNYAKTDAEFSNVFNKYFNRKNYITWLALNIVFGNKDTVSQNFFLLNPKYTDVFYFLPWDYDGGLREENRYTKFEFGIGNWWGIPLHRKFLNIKQNRDDLDAMVNNLRNNYVTTANVEEKINNYKSLIESYFQEGLPDYEHLRPDRLIEEMGLIDTRIQESIDNYNEQKGSPMPFWQNIEYDGNILKLSWEESIDLEGDELLYDIFFLKQISHDEDKNVTENENIDYVADSLLYELNVDVNNSEKITKDGSWYTYTTEANLTIGEPYYMFVRAKEKYNPSSYQIPFNKAVRLTRVVYVCNEDDPTICQHDIVSLKYFGLLEYVYGGTP